MGNTPISDSEAEVMKVLWRKSPRTLPEIVEAVMAVNAWKNVTVKTLLRRLVEKRAVAQEGDRRNYRYSPLISKDDYVEAVGRELLARGFNDSPAAMLSFFVARGKISAADLKALETQISELKDE
ncbi:MAG: BlaI/MecI/CopY family transcriptional regulator [Victivallaceae bacterium]|nr:BlaI/MecI/CopY family transcriptional regulator [Victivallaceae bacterium]